MIERIILIKSSINDTINERKGRTRVYEKERNGISENESRVKVVGATCKSWNTLETDARACNEISLKQRVLINEQCYHRSRSRLM